MSYIPKGCDQQGRYPEAAEAATDVGVEDDFEPDYTAMVKDIAIAVVIICVISLFVAGAINGRLR
jgi:hypothetical protein